MSVSMYNHTSQNTRSSQEHQATSGNVAMLRDVRKNLTGIADEMKELKKDNGSMKEENRRLTIQNGELSDRNTELTDVRRENQVLNDEIDRLKASYESAEAAAGSDDE